MQSGFCTLIFERFVLMHGFSGQTGAYKWAKLVKQNKAIYIIKTGLRKVKMTFRAYLTLSQPG
jgi:hypothetical protein